MSPMNKQSSNSSSNCGEGVATRVNVLASCYIVSNTAQLKGLHYCTTGVTGKEYLYRPACQFLSSLDKQNAKSDSSLGAEWYS